MPKKNNLFEATHHFKNKFTANEAKTAMLVNTATLNFDLAQCFKRYLQRLAHISPISYKAQRDPIRKSMIQLYKNAQTFANAKVANK